MTTLPILLVEDDDDLREALSDTLELAGYDVVCAAEGESALRLLREKQFSILLSDVQMRPMDGETLLLRVRAEHSYLPVVLMTAYGLIEKAVSALQAGAAHYLAKPFEPSALLEVITRYRLSTDASSIGDELIACDAAMKRLLELAKRVALSDATVLISGESGTGKEVLARYIHRHSARSTSAFVAVNCAAIPEQLLESTLFGHEKGAFTGAASSHMGKFEQAEGGTLLLDEVTEMPLELQAKLLRVLQERELERVGGNRVIKINIRVIGTTNRDIAEQVKLGKFREDLYYRLNVFPIRLPALRERVGDIMPMARALLAKHATEMHRRALHFSPAAEQCLLQHHWGGNVRELDNVVQRALILAPGDEIGAEHLLLPEVAADEPASPPVLPAAAEAGRDMRSLEKVHILRVLEETGGVRKLAAERLGMSERTLRYRLSQYRSDNDQER